MRNISNNVNLKNIYISFRGWSLISFKIKNERASWNPPQVKHHNWIITKIKVEIDIPAYALSLWQSQSTRFLESLRITYYLTVRRMSYNGMSYFAFILAVGRVIKNHLK